MTKTSKMLPGDEKRFDKNAELYAEQIAKVAALLRQEAEEQGEVLPVEWAYIAAAIAQSTITKEPKY